MMTIRCMGACGLNSLVVFFNAKTYDIWEENITTERRYKLRTSVHQGFGLQEKEGH